MDSSGERLCANVENVNFRGVAVDEFKVSNLIKRR